MSLPAAMDKQSIINDILQITGEGGPSPGPAPISGGPMAPQKTFPGMAQSGEYGAAPLPLFATPTPALMAPLLLPPPRFRGSQTGPTGEGPTSTQRLPGCEHGAAELPGAVPWREEQ